MPDTNSVASETTDKIILGSGHLFAVKYDGTSIPDEEALCVDANLLGHIQGGATLEYTIETYEAKDDLGEARKEKPMSDKAVLKSGTMTINGAVIQKLVSTATSTMENDKRVTMIGGVGNSRDNRYVVCFRNKDEVDGDTYVTLVGQNTGSFNLAFAKDKESVVDIEFNALPAFGDGRLVRLTEVPSTVG